MNQAHDMKPADQLRSAARLVERALDQLDLKEAPCAHCGTRLFHNMPEAKINEALANTPERLRSAADRLDELAGKPAARRIADDGRRMG